ncbi:hypothetical protein QJQ45_003886 [Haematococcus lacustris]|nr:hypothetical protein QJQ45_003886 [Haematococcus lacustris]
MQLPLLNWKPVYSSGLAASYPSLISLTLRFLDLSTCRLGRLVSHPALLPLLKHLDVCEADIVNKAQPASRPFTGSRLQQLRLGWGYWDFTPHLAPLAPHLTQLAVASVESNESGFVGSLSSLAAAVGSLTCLQSLELGINGVEAGDCLTHPLQLAQLGGVGPVGAEVLAAAELNLCERNKAGLEVDDMWLGRGSFDLLTKQHVSRNCPAAHQTPHPTVASSSSGQEGSQGSAAGGQAPMQHLSYCVKKLVDMRRSTQLLDLPEELLGAVLRQLRDGNSRLQVLMTSKRLATALLQHTPSIQLTHPLAVDLVCAPGDERCIHPFLAQALLTRKAHLELTLQPEGKLPAQQRPKRGGLLAVTLGAVELCPAVTHLIISFPKGLPRPVYIWKPVYSSGLAASYPSLTSLTLRSFQLSSTQLGRLLSHPALLPRLKHLDVCGTDIMNKAQPAPSPFTGSRLQQLRLGWGYWEFMPHLAPLAPHLTRLEVASAEINDSGFVGSLSSLAVAVGTLTCLQSLKFDLDDLEAGDWFLPVLVPMLASLPSLHTLLLLQETVHGDQVDVLLAATQITHLQVYSISCLVFSRVSAACSWRRLEVEEMDWLSAAHLPLHSLTHPLQLAQLGGVGPVGAEVLAAAELNLCERNKAGLEVEDMWLGRGSFDLLTAQYVSRSRPAAQQPPKPTVASSSSGQEGSQGSAAGGQAPMQRLGRCVKGVVLWSSHGWNEVITGFLGSGKRVKLDGVVTVVDAKHVSRHLDTPKEAGVVNEAVEQIAFADRILLNKTDLVDAASLGPLEARLQAINKMATTTRSQRAQKPDGLTAGAKAPGGSTTQADQVRLPAGLPAGPGPAQPQEVWQQGEGGWEVLLAMAGRMRKRFRSTAAKIHKPRVAAVRRAGAAAEPVLSHPIAAPQHMGGVSDAAGQAAKQSSSPEPCATAAGAAGAAAAGAAVAAAGSQGLDPVALNLAAAGQVRLKGPSSEVLQCLKQMLAVVVGCQAAGVLSLCSGESLAACQRAIMTMRQTISYDCIAHCTHTDIAAAAAAQTRAQAAAAVAAAAQESRKGSEALDTSRE